MKPRHWLLLLVVLSLSLFAPGLPDAFAKTRARKSTLFPVGGSSSPLAVDPSGTLHVAFQSSKYRVKHAWRQGGRWRKQTVDASDSGSDSSMAVDSLGRVHIAYHADHRQVLAYALIDGIQTTITDVDDGGYATDIAVDSDDRPHISYYGSGGNTLKHAKLGESGWEIEDTGSTGLYFFPTSLALDSSDAAHISFTRRSTNDIATYATNASGSWVTTDLAEQPGGHVTTSLALDPLDRSHVAVTIDQTVRYLSFDGAAWQSEDVYQETDVTQFPDYVALALDSQDRPHVLFSTYVRAPHGQGGVEVTLYAYNDGTTWLGGIVDRGNAGFETAIAVDADDDVHGTYRKALPGERSNLKYVRIPRE